MTTPRVEALTIVGEPDRWRSVGLTVTDDGLVPLIGTSLRILDADATARDDASDAPAAARAGIVGWELSGAADTSSASIDGLMTSFVDAAAPVFAAHELGASALDHVVVLTPELERTSAAIAEATGCELKRIREVGSMRQGFHRIGRGGLIVELVERPEVPEGPAAFWGLVLIVDDLDHVCSSIGSERISPPKDAVQPGRRIATVRDEVGLGLPVALMTA